MPALGARLVDAATGTELAGKDLLAEVDAARAEYDDAPPGTVFVLLPTSFAAVVGYLGALATGRPVALLDPNLPHLHGLVSRFCPAVVTGAGDVGPAPEGYWAEGGAWRRWAKEAQRPNPELTLLLATSGSTGDPKLVRLSGTALVASADAIVAALGIGPDDVAITALPLYYTLGLSVLHSHLRAGATVVVTAAQLFQREFWSTVDSHGVTSLTAVPYQFEILHRIGFDAGRHPSLRTLATSGGRLRRELALDFHARMGGGLYLMYGATEATARMTVLPPHRLPDKPDSVGLPVPGGRISISAHGEVLFAGPNVMMGYASAAADLALGDDTRGVLATGDLGHLDDEGYLYLDGRIRRLGKVFGVRVNLDDIESMLGGAGPVATLAGDDRVLVLVEGASPARCEQLRAELAERLRLHGSGFIVRGVAELPRRGSGKVDYAALAEYAR